MTNNLNQPPYLENEITFQEVIKTLIESKVLIISSILIITFLSLIISTQLKNHFNSSVIIEIGHTERTSKAEKIDSTADGVLYYPSPDVLIEKPNILIEGFKRYLYYQKIENCSSSSVKCNLDNVKINYLLSRLVSIEVNSDSVEKNQKLLNSFVIYIEKRHDKIIEKISNLARQKLLNEIDINQAEQSIIQRQLSENKIIINQLGSLAINDTSNQRLDFLTRNFELSKQLSALSLELKYKQLNLNSLNNQIIYRTRSIGKIKNSNLRLPNSIIILLGFIVGLIIGISLAFLKNAFRPS
jgi:capsular polysaccharide biosynthesis protein